MKSATEAHIEEPEQQNLSSNNAAIIVNEGEDTHQAIILLFSLVSNVLVHIQRPK